MAEADPIKRLKAAARRASGPVTVEIQRNWYLDELGQDLGRDPGGISGWEPAPRPSRGILRFILKMLALAVVVFAATSTFLLWRNGAFQSLLPEMPKATQSRPWTLGGALDPLPPPQTSSESTNEKDAPPNLIEPLARPAAAPAAEEDTGDAGDGGEG